MTLSAILGEYAARTCYDDLPNAAVTAAKNSLLDAIGVTLAASGIGEGCGAFVDLARETGGRQESTIIGYRCRVPVADAAFANGAMAHAVDFEDAHDLALVHPNAATVPAALAVAEAAGSVGGKELITALTVGCDLVCRLGLSLEADPALDGWYFPPMLGAFGAAAAAGKLLGLDPRQMVDAFSLTLCQTTCSAELKYSPDSMVRAVRDGFAARAGVVSAQLAAKGVRGFDRPFEGKAGLFALYARNRFNPDLLTADLGRRFEGVNVGFKPWPSCRGTHPHIEAALRIAAKPGFRPDAVTQIFATVNNVNLMLCEPAAQKRRPATAIDAKFSLPFTVATALRHGEVTLDSFTAEALCDEGVLSLAGKLSHQVDPDLGLRQAVQGKLEVHCADGTVYCEAVDQVYGSSERPLSPDDLMAKFIECAAHAATPVPATALDRFVVDVMAIEGINDIGRCIRSL